MNFNHENMIDYLINYSTSDIVLNSGFTNLETLKRTLNEEHTMANKKIKNSHKVDFQIKNNNFSCISPVKVVSSQKKESPNYENKIHAKVSEIPIKVTEIQRELEKEALKRSRDLESEMNQPESKKINTTDSEIPSDFDFDGFILYDVFSPLPTTFEVDTSFEKGSIQEAYQIESNLQKIADYVSMNQPDTFQMELKTPLKVTLSEVPDQIVPNIISKNTLNLLEIKEKSLQTIVKDTQPIFKDDVTQPLKELPIYSHHPDFSTAQGCCELSPTKIDISDSKFAFTISDSEESDNQESDSESEESDNQESGNERFESSVVKDKVDLKNVQSNTKRSKTSIRSIPIPRIPKKIPKNAEKMIPTPIDLEALDAYLRGGGENGYYYRFTSTGYIVGLNWTPEEDEILIKFTKLYKGKSFGLVAKELEFRKGFQCSTRIKQLIKNKQLDLDFYETKENGNVVLKREKSQKK